MAAKTVYVCEEDVTLWEQIGVIAQRQRRSTSWILHEALRYYLRGTAIEQEQAFRDAAKERHAAT